MYRRGGLRGSIRRWRCGLRQCEVRSVKCGVEKQILHFPTPVVQDDKSVFVDAAVMSSSGKVD
jgi:hypothetical protein